MPENYVIVHRSYDPVQTDLVGEILRENGIDARVLGTRHGAVIGVGQNILQMHIEVPRSQAGEATNFLEDFFATDGSELLAEVFPPEKDDDEAGERSARHGLPRAPDAERGAYDPDGPRRPMFAAALALILGVIGAGHLYARRPATAMVLTVGQAIAILAMLSPEWQTVATGLFGFALLVAVDLIGALRAVSAHNRGVRVSIVGQLANGLALVAVAALVSWLVGPRIPAPESRNGGRTELIAPAL